MTWTDNSLLVPCPKCDADRGNHCVSTAGEPARESHEQRWGLAIDCGVKLTDLLNMLHRIGSRGLKVEMGREMVPGD